MAAEQSAEELCQEALACLQRRESQRALELYESAIAANPDFVLAHERLAGLCFAQKNYEKAVALFQRVAALQPRRADPLINVGAVYNRMGKHQEASKTLLQALSRDRRSPEAYYNLGLAYRGLKQLSMAVSAYKEAIRLAPEMSEAYLNLGRVYLEMKNNTQAVLNFERALQIDPQFEKAKACLLMARGQVQQAKQSMSPFGRLVDVSQIELRSTKTESCWRPLNPEEQLQDRMEVQRLAKGSEQCAVALLNQLREELSPAVLELTRVVTEGILPQHWMEEAESLANSTERFQEFNRILQGRINELKAHQKKLKRSDI